MIILDTDVLIEIMDKRSDKWMELVKSLAESGNEVVTTPINLHEILYGLFKVGRDDIIDKVMELNVIEFSKKDAYLSSKLEVEMEKRGRKVARLDCMIAAMALNRDAYLYTLNIKHFTGFEEFNLRLFGKT
jgi:tRNA(fMet)-specific endonuclease VapC